VADAAKRGDLRWGTIPRLVEDAAGRFGVREAVIDGDARLSFTDLAAAVREAARGAIAAGVEPGDRVGIWAPNVWEWIVAALGAIAAGAVLVPVNTRFKGREAGYLLDRSGARLLFTVTDFLDTDYPAMLRDARDEFPLPSLESVVVLRGPAPAGTTSWDRFLEAGAAVSPRVPESRAGAPTPESLSDVIFTSGTTGRPKGAMTTHAQTLRVFEVWSRGVGLRESDRYLIVNPFFHTFGYKAGILACLMRGATIHPQAVFDAAETMRRVADHRITVLPGPPTLYQSILDHPERGRYDLSSLRLAVTGAAVGPVELIRRMREELTFDSILTAYGLTE